MTLVIFWSSVGVSHASWEVNPQPREKFGGELRGVMCDVTYSGGSRHCDGVQCRVSVNVAQCRHLPTMQVRDSPSALPLLGNFPNILGIWESNWNLGNFPSNHGNSGIFRKFREILVIPNLQRLTSVVFIRYLTACHSAMFLQLLLLLTYHDHFLNIARLTHLL